MSNSEGISRTRAQRLDAGPVEQATSPPTNPYVTLPDPSTSYIQLRFQLVHFSGVYRTVKVPLNYTFANLHTLIQFLFGWSNSHLHVSQVYTHVTMYSTWGSKAWHMKRFGHPPSPPEWLLNDASDPARETYFWNLKHENAAFYRVEAMTRRRRRAKADNFGEGGDYRKRVEDQELTLAMVWDPVKNRNLTRGECENTELGIQYEYNFCADWHVHITLDNSSHFFTVSPPNNIPIIVEAKGAPPVEDAYEDIPREVDAKKKTIDPLLYEDTAFQRYCANNLNTRTEAKKLAVSVVSR